MSRFLLVLFLCASSLFAWCQSQDDSFTLRTIIIEGNKRTKERYITRELSFEIGKIYKRSDLDSIYEWNKNRIYNTFLFNTIDFELVNESNNEADLKVIVDERWYFYPEPVLKPVDRNPLDWWVNRGKDFSRVNYGIRMTHFNFRGRGEFLRVWLQTGFSNIVTVRYRIPYIDRNQKHGLIFNLGYLDSKNIAYTTENNIPRFASSDNKVRYINLNSISHSYRSAFYGYHYTTIGHSRMKIAQGVVDLNENYLGNNRTLQRYFFAGYNFIWDKRNNRNYPTTGEFFSISMLRNGLGVYNDGVSYWEGSLDLKKFWELKPKLFLASDLNVLTTFGSDRAYYNYDKIGFKKDVLRGHDLYVVEGSSYVLQRNELRYLIFGKTYNIKKIMPIKQYQTFPIYIYGKIFVDQGYVRSYAGYTGSDLLTDQHLTSYGAGIDLYSVYDRVFRFEYSKNTLGETVYTVNFLSIF